MLLVDFCLGKNLSINHIHVSILLLYILFLKYGDALVYFEIHLFIKGHVSNRASKSFRRADARLCNFFDHMRKICIFECKTGNTGTFL